MNTKPINMVLGRLLHRQHPLRACLSFLIIGMISGGSLNASVIVERNPFSPDRKPWKQETPPPPPLPILTPMDLQIEAIVSFGALQGIVAQLEGKLKGVLPANAAGKVRIQLGQSFGPGYILEKIEANQVVILGGGSRYAVPVVRRANRGAPPAPAMLQPAAQQAPQVVSPDAPGTPTAAAPFQAPSSGDRPASGYTAADIQPPPVSAPPAPLPVAESQPQNVAQPLQPSQQQPMSLLDAIMKARQATNSGGSPAQSGNPFQAK